MGAPLARRGDLAPPARLKASSDARPMISRPTGWTEPRFRGDADAWIRTQLADLDARLDGPGRREADSSRQEVRTACALALRLGWVCRAVNDHLPGIDAGPTSTRLRMFLDGHP